jgi:hypothetical protein
MAAVCGRLEGGSDEADDALAAPVVEAALRR